MALDTLLNKKSKIKNTEPKKYKVVFLNDNTTPMDFVVMVLMDIFNHDFETAEKIMLDIHEKGQGIAGVYNFEIAETKHAETIATVRANKFKLQVKLEEV